MSFPTIGQGATIAMWSDRHAGTIIDVAGNTVVFQQDKATRVDKNGMSESQSYEYAPNPQGKITIFTKRKNGQYVQKGSGMKTGQRLQIGYRSEHYDYSF